MKRDFGKWSWLVSRRAIYTDCVVHCTRYVQQWWDLYGPHEATEKMLLSDSRIPERGERGRGEGGECGTGRQLSGDGEQSV